MVFSNDKLEVNKRASEEVDFDKRSIPLEERVARVQSREKVDESGLVKNQKPRPIINILESSRASMSRPSTILGFDKLQPGSAGLVSFMGQSPLHRLDEKRHSRDSQFHSSIPK